MYRLSNCLPLLCKHLWRCTANQKDVYKRQVLLPFFIAWLIAYMVYPLVKFFQYKLRLKSRIVSIFCTLFLITLVGVSLFYLLVPPMVSEIGRMNDLLVTYLTNGAGNNVPKNLSEFIHENIDLQALNRILSEEKMCIRDRL